MIEEDPVTLIKNAVARAAAKLAIWEDHSTVVNAVVEELPDFFWGPLARVNDKAGDTTRSDAARGTDE